MLRGRARTRVAGAVGLVVTVALASGCVGLRNVSGTQPQPIGDVRVSAVVCASGAPGCGGRGNSDTVPLEGAQGQILLGVRVPAGAVAPPTVFAPGVAFAVSDTYASELRRLAPASAGTRWVGYISDTVTHTAATSAAGLPVTAEFGMPVTPGIPFAGPFRHRPVVGARSVTPAAPATRPVTCGASLTSEQPDGPDGVVICVDWPSTGTLGSDLSVTTQDIAIVAGATRIPAEAGAVVGVPFALRHAGRGAPLAVVLAASTSLPGATVAPSPATVVPAEGGEHAVVVTLAVPARARAAIHGVTLRATLPGGGMREMTTRVVVRRPAGAAPLPSTRPRALRLDWRPDRRARFYNLQVFRGSRKILSVFPTADRRVVRLRPGRYSVRVWTAARRTPRVVYVRRPWVNRVITVRPAATAAARARPMSVRLR